jgi:long-chain acyl-CoA synthetase
MVEQAETITELFQRRVTTSAAAAAYRHFDASTGAFATTNWGDIAARVSLWRAALAGEGLRHGDRVAIRLPNSIDWVCFDQAALSLGLVVVPLFLTDAAAAIAHALADSGARLALFDTADQWRAVAARPGLGALQRIVCRSGDVPDGASRVESWLQAAAGRHVAACETRPESLASIVYTSGTTGPPKGVMLSHRNLVSVVFAVLDRQPARAHDVFLSYLPLAHIFERVIGYYVPIASGACVAFARSVDDLKADMGLVRPSVMLFVPSVLERIRQGLRAELAGGRFADRQLRVLDAVAEGRRLSPGQAAFKVFLTLMVRRRFGGRLRLAVSGGAPLAPDLARFCLALGLPLTEGYGLTEAASAVAAATREGYRPGCVGPPLRGTEIRIGPQGEILVRAPGVMKAYWNRPKDSAETLVDGWLHTGDSGAIENANLVVTGRLKDILVLSTGHKIAPTEIERSLGLDPLVRQAMVVGDGRPFLAALVVLHDPGWTRLAEGLGLDPGADASLALARAAVLEQLSQRLRAFPTYAQIRAVHLCRDPWTIDHGLLTPTQKLKRRKIETKFASVLAELYETTTHRP